MALNSSQKNSPIERQFSRNPRTTDILQKLAAGKASCEKVTFGEGYELKTFLIRPDRIKYCPNVVLEVVLSTTVKHVHVDSPISTPNPGFESTVLHKLDEVLKRVQEANDRLILIQSKTEAILTQNYELLEYTIPRLFIVLPEKSTSWDPKTMFRTKFRLHFICECGEHTKASGSKIPHHLHLANHEGYVVNKPTEFFKKYGPFLTLMLEMIKVGTIVAGHVVPALASLKVVDILDSTQSTIDSVTSKVIEGVDYSLKYLEESRTLIQKSDGVDVDGNARMSQQDLDTYLAGVEGLEGVDLRQLGSYLSANSSDNLLGNLFRMTTKDGHVKWVCRHHYRAAYQEAHTQKLHDAVKLAGGVFDEQLGSIKVTLRSSFAAAEFYEAIIKAKAGVYDLDITFDWDCTRSDLEGFEKALKMEGRSSSTVGGTQGQHRFDHFRLEGQLDWEGRSSSIVGGTQDQHYFDHFEPMDQLNWE
ncbi:hypothetical protein EDD21DRAFT_356660 [Dissophora ornata]|nr:hypothetical protein EDD21DRAFT_356660 [Dissophora ornata]